VAPSDPKPPVPWKAALSEGDWLHLAVAAVIAVANLITLYVRLKNRQE
jgi:hypothetical protein